MKDLFCCETGYQTPKLATRAAVFQGDKVLLVQEPKGWALPGGWVDHNVLGEGERRERGPGGGRSGGPGRPGHRRYGRGETPRHRLSLEGVYRICPCTLLGGQFRANLETTASGWFSLDDLPQLDLEKTTPEQLRMCLEASRAVHWETVLE